MYSVSNNYKTQINKPCRNVSHLRINIYAGYKTAEQASIFSIDTSLDTNAVDIVEGTWTREYDPLNTKLPTETFSFKFIDSNKLYSPDDASGQWAELEKQLPVKFEFGYTLGDGSVEWHDGSVYITTGQNRFETNGIISLITIEAKSVINYLSGAGIKQAYLKSDYYNLINNVLGKCTLKAISNGWFSWSIDNSLKNFSVIKPIDAELPINQCLQLISQASCCDLFTDRSGNVKIIPHKTTAENYNIDFSCFLEIPECYKYPALSELNISYSTGNEDEGTSNWAGKIEEGEAYEWSESTLPITDSGYISRVTEFTGFYRRLKNGGNTSYDKDNVRKYAPSCASADTNGYVYGITALNEGIDAGRQTITVEIRRPEYIRVSFEIEYATLSAIASTEQQIYNINTYGEPCTIDNAVISDIDSANRVKNECEKFLGMRNRYQDVPYRGNPEIDVGDIIKVQTLYSASENALVYKNEIVYNGALSGTLGFYTGGSSQ